MAIIEPRTLKGFRDYAPREQLARQAMFLKIQSVFERFGFLPLSTPVLEYKEILMGKYGDDEKLIYSFKDNGDRDVAMRYDLTVPLARFVAENQNRLTFPFKRYQIAPVWRAENTQKGRLREFYQCDIDIVEKNPGPWSSLGNAEVIACIYTALIALGIQNLEIRFSNRMLFWRLLSSPEGDRAALLRGLDKFQKIGLDGVKKYLQQQGVTEQGITEAEKITALGIGKEALENITLLFPEAADVAGAVRSVMFDMVQLGVPEDVLVFDPLIVRGLEYYTNLVFEITLRDSPEFGSIAGGGRYDGLVGKFTDQEFVAVGGAIGIDRLFEYLESKNLIPDISPVQALVLNFDDKLLRDRLKLLTELRGDDMKVELYYEPAKLDKQFKYAESKNIPFAILYGEAEKESGMVKIKNLKTREQVEVTLSELVKALK